MEFMLGFICHTHTCTARGRLRWRKGGKVVRERQEEREKEGIVEGEEGRDGVREGGRGWDGVRQGGRERG